MAIKISKILDSQQNWKSKAKQRQSKIATLKKAAQRKKRRVAKDARDREAFDRITKENEELRAMLANNRPSNVSPSNVSLECIPPIRSRGLCVLLVLAGVVSFRSVPRILMLFQPALCFPVTISHFTSVIHWILRAGVAVFKHVAPLAERWVALIDCSIDIGARKTLVVLRVPLSILQKKGRAIGLQDCECVGMEISSSWDGESIRAALTRIFSVAGAPAAILKDQGSDLKKGVKLWNQRATANPIPVIEDVGHFAANILKSMFMKSPLFFKFLKIVSEGSARIRQTALAWLLPPKLRIKGRFQGITQIADWAQNVLKKLDPTNPAGCVDADKVHKAFPGLKRLTPFLNHFCQVCSITEDFLKLLKTKGLNETTYQQAKELVAKPSTPPVLQTRLSNWLETHIQIFRELDIPDLSLLVSSDPIESLFGKFKTMVQRNPRSELNRLLYIIPLLCGNHSQITIEQALQQCSHSEMLAAIKRTVPETLRQQREKKLGSCQIAVPKTGGSPPENSK